MKAIILAAGLFLASAESLAGAGSSPIQIKVDVAPSGVVSGSPSLKARLHNLGQQAISIDKARLPWGNRYSLTMLAVPLDSKYEQPLPLVFPIDDVLPGEVTIRPGDVFEGTIQIDSVFKDVKKRLRTTPLHILWTYKLVSNDGRESDTLSGSFVFPRLTGDESTK